MPEVARETAYYLNLKARVVALISEGVRFPRGRWIRVADGSALAWLVEEGCVSGTQGQVITIVTLGSESEVKEFEHSFPSLK